MPVEGRVSPACIQCMVLIQVSMGPVVLRHGSVSCLLASDSAERPQRRSDRGLKVCCHEKPAPVCERDVLYNTDTQSTRPNPRRDKHASRPAPIISTGGLSAQVSATISPALRVLGRAREFGSATDFTPPPSPSTLQGVSCHSPELPNQVHLLSPPCAVPYLRVLRPVRGLRPLRAGHLRLVCPNARVSSGASLLRADEGVLSPQLRTAPVHTSAHPALAS